jgi:hypothetical protein
MKVRRLVVAFAVLIAGPAAWAASAEPASAGGPTSVLLSDPVSGRVGALYHTQADYQRLAEVVGAYKPDEGEINQPDAVHNGTHEYRLTWLIHDMRVWRIDLLYETADGLWINSKVDQTGDQDPLAQMGRWNQLDHTHKAKLSAVFRNAGILGKSGAVTGESAESAPEVAPDPTSEVATGAANTPGGPTAGAVAAGAGLAGLVIGTGGTLLLRRARSTSRRPRAVLMG